jgi:hypothetical protein
MSGSARRVANVYGGSRREAPARSTRRRSARLRSRAMHDSDYSSGGLATPLQTTPEAATDDRAAYGQLAESGLPQVIQDEFAVCRWINKELRRSTRRSEGLRRYHSFEGRDQVEYLSPEFITDQVSRHATMVGAVKAHYMASFWHVEAPPSPVQDDKPPETPSPAEQAMHEALTLAVLIDTAISAEIPNARGVLEVLGRRLQALFYVHESQNKFAAWKLARRLESRLVRKHLPGSLQVTPGLYGAMKERSAWMRIDRAARARAVNTF